MPITLQNDKELFSPADAERLWQTTIAHTHHADDEVTVKFVTEEEIQRLNREYREKDAPTNVLTFSYGTEHDVAVCWVVVEQEARERGITVRDYAALVLVHAFLHVVGMDHEQSPEEAEKTHAAEKVILSTTGFTSLAL
jgi:probable rRNA maturation factor